MMGGELANALNNVSKDGKSLITLLKEKNLDRLEVRFSQNSWTIASLLSQPAMRTHNSNLYQCVYCNFTSESYNEIATHTRTDHR